jgi:hypothetical protein
MSDSPKMSANLSEKEDTPPTKPTKETLETATEFLRTCPRLPKDENILCPKALRERFGVEHVTKHGSFTVRSFLRQLDREACGLGPEAWAKLLPTRKARETLESAANFLKTCPRSTEDEGALCPKALRERFGAEQVTKKGSFTRRSFLRKLDREACGIEPETWERLFARASLRGRPSSDFPFRSGCDSTHELPTLEQLQALDLKEAIRLWHEEKLESFTNLNQKFWLGVAIALSLNEFCCSQRIPLQTRVWVPRTSESSDPGLTRLPTYLCFALRSWSSGEIHDWQNSHIENRLSLMTFGWHWNRDTLVLRILVDFSFRQPSHETAQHLMRKAQECGDGLVFVERGGYNCWFVPKGGFDGSNIDDISKFVISDAKEFSSRIQDILLDDAACQKWGKLFDLLFLEKSECNDRPLTE